MNRALMFELLEDGELECQASMEIFFVIQGDFDPDEISKQLDLVPSSTTPLGHYKHFPKKATWTIDLGKIYRGEFEKMNSLLSELKIRMSGKECSVSNLKNIFDLRVLVVIHVRTLISNTVVDFGFFLDESSVQFLSIIGAELSFSAVNTLAI